MLFKMLLAPRFLEGVDPQSSKIHEISRLQCADNEELLLYQNSDSDTDEEEDDSNGPALTPETPPISNDSSLMLSVDLSSSIMNSSVLDMEVSD